MRFLNISALKGVAISSSGYFIMFFVRKLENMKIQYKLYSMKTKNPKEKIMMKHKTSFTLIELLVDTACFPCKASKV